MSETKPREIDDRIRFTTILTDNINNIRVEGYELAENEHSIFMTEYIENNKIIGMIPAVNYTNPSSGENEKYYLNSILFSESQLKAIDSNYTKLWGSECKKICNDIRQGKEFYNRKYEYMGIKSEFRKDELSNLIIFTRVDGSKLLYIDPYTELLCKLEEKQQNAPQQDER